MMHAVNTYKIYTDGGSRGNPGDAAYGFVVYRNGQKIFEEGQEIGTNTNNVAEYSGVVNALRWLVHHTEGEEKEIQFFMDSQLVANQMIGNYKIKNEGLKRLFQQAKNLEHQLGVPIVYTSIPREKNKEADRMVNLALDHKT